MGKLMKDGVSYTGGSAPLIDGLNSTSNTAALTAKQGNVLANDMGVIEPTTQAVRAHAVGEYFIWIGQFVKVTAAIAAGDTIAIGSNVAATNVASVLSELNSKLNVTTIGGSEWIPGHQYIVDDIVIYNNILYRCIKYNSSPTPPNQQIDAYWKITSMWEINHRTPWYKILSDISELDNYTDAGLAVPNFLYVDQGGNYSVAMQFGNLQILSYVFDNIVQIRSYHYLNKTWSAWTRLI